MDSPDLISEIKSQFPQFCALSVSQDYSDELCIKIQPEIFKETCLAIHKALVSPVMMLFALDERAKCNTFVIKTVFLNAKKSQWIIVSMDIVPETPYFDSLSKSVYSAHLFEREIFEMFGIEPKGNPDLRRLRLHDEVWPQGNFPLRKDFKKPQAGELTEYKFNKVDGEGIFEVPVGPVHAGVIGSGHFRFSVAGEPIIHLESRLGFTHRGAEKLFEGKSPAHAQTVQLAECIAGDSAFAHSLAFTQAAEKISGITIPLKATYIRAVFLELERMYNHVNDIGGIALDVGFSFPAALASVIKEAILQLNEKWTASRYLKSVNAVGGTLIDIDENQKNLIRNSLRSIEKDFNELVKILYSSVSFMDRVEATGVLKRKTAEDLGVIGLSGRASGIAMDLRKCFPGVYGEAKFKMIVEQPGDVLARLKLRILEFQESARLIERFSSKIIPGEPAHVPAQLKRGKALGYAEGWRGPVLYWVETDSDGFIDRCKIVDPSFHNWPGLSFAVLGNIIPDFPLCNKSFDLSYSGNDL